MATPAIGKGLIVLGLAITLLGAAFLFADRLPFLKSLGRLPGDMSFKGENWQVHMPLATSLILSVVLSGIFWLISYLGNRGGR
ncbi:MAG: DUF2905 domain-containing protein [Bdellovibrionota bacterium]